VRRSLVASVVPVAALVVLLASGSAAPTQLVAVGKGPGTPPRLSSTALAAWAGADRRAGEAEAAYVTAVASCRDQTPGGMAGADDCLSISQHSLLVEVDSALATARTLYGADGPCGRSLRVYHARLDIYRASIRRWSAAALGGALPERAAAWHAIGASWSDTRDAVRVVRDACTPQL
jgi:hypothetical protein